MEQSMHHLQSMQYPCHYLITDVEQFSHCLSFSNFPPLYKFKLGITWWLDCAFQKLAYIRCSIAAWVCDVWKTAESNPEWLWHGNWAAARWQETDDPYGCKLSPSSVDKWQHLFGALNNAYHFIVEARNIIFVFIARLEEDGGYSLANAGESSI